MKKNTEPVKCKQALATLHKLYREYIRIITLDQFRQNKALRDEVYDAFVVLACTLYGEPAAHQFSSLCDVCHLGYADQFGRRAGQTLTRWCCTPCAEQLQAEQLLEEVADGDKEVRR